MTDFPSSPVTESLIRRLEDRFGDGQPYLLAASEVEIVLASLLGHAQTGQLCVPVADIQAVVEIAGRNEYAPQISRVRAWLSALSDTSTDRPSGPTPGFRLIEEPCEHHHCEFPSCGCEVPVSSPERGDK